MTDGENSKRRPFLSLWSKKHNLKLLLQKIIAKLRREKVDPRIDDMLKVLSTARAEILPSAYWKKLNQSSLELLKRYGYRNFKQTIAKNFFTWTIFVNDQIQFLKKHLSADSIDRCIELARSAGFHDLFTDYESKTYSLLTFMLWEYVRQNDPEGLLNSLSEPSEGNPPKVELNGKMISQDIANSLLEFKSIRSNVEFSRTSTMMELGAGYGRTACVFLKLLPNVRYLIVDLPPALYLSERYLSNQFPDKRIFRFQDFHQYSEIEGKLQNADIAFFLPNQLELLPDNITDLFINISSFQEMRPEQIQYYFREVNRLTKDYVYLKQWKDAPLPCDTIRMTENVYPIPKYWREIYWRECQVQTGFFEALFQISSKNLDPPLPPNH